MSQLEVDKIIPQSGTTLTIGDSGDTITFADGAVIGIDTDTLYIDSTNNRVGIGTSSPTEKLEVHGTEASGGVEILLVNEGDGGISTTPYTSIRSLLNPSRNGGEIRFGRDSTYGSLADADSNLQFYTAVDDVNTERMRIDSSGNVVIGSGGLDVSGVGGTYTALNMRAGSGYPIIYGQTTATATNSSAMQLLGATSGASAGGAAEMLGVIQIACESDSSTNATGYINFYTGSGGGVSEKMRIDSSGNVGIGTSSPSYRLDVSGVNSLGRFLSASTASELQIITPTVGVIGFDTGTSDTLYFGTTGTERMRIDSSGNVLVGKTVNDENTDGIRLSSGGLANFARDSGGVMTLNRNGTDGTVVDIRGQGTTEGTISISGATVAYNGFTGTHWSRLSDNSKPTILKGTILESLDEMMDWYQVQFDITDEEGNTTTKKESYALGDGESVGDVITYNFEGTDYQATIIQEGDVKHTKSKISDTVDAKNVYGVFMAWDNDDDTVNDMYVAQTGTFVVRMNSAETVSKGDLIQSNGDGTGKVQADDIIRSSTVAKILSTTKIETYEDGSYIVPCSLHC